MLHLDLEFAPPNSTVHRTPCRSLPCWAYHHAVCSTAPVSSKTLAALRAPAGAALSPGNRFTIEFWLFLEAASPNKSLVSRKLDTDPHMLYEFYIDSSGTAVSLAQSSGPGTGRSTAFATIPLRTWTHI